MKKNTLYLALLLTFLSIELNAQIRNKLNIGVGLDFGTEVDEGGLDVRVGYFLTKQLNLVIDINYFFVDDEVFIKDRYWNEYNLNVHYYFDYNFNEKLVSFYGLAGFNLSTLGFKYSKHPTFGDSESKESNLGLNLGGGVDFNLTKNFKPFIEAKYLLIDEIDQVEIAFGIKYVF